MKYSWDICKLRYHCDERGTGVKCSCYNDCFPDKISKDGEDK